MRDEEGLLFGLLFCVLVVTALMTLGGCALGQVERPRVMYWDGATNDIYVKTKATIEWRETE
jgi:hypothetical protein